MTSQMTVNLCSWETEYRTMNVIHSQLRSRPNTSLLWICNRINLVILMKKFICTLFFYQFVLCNSLLKASLYLHLRWKRKITLKNFILFISMKYKVYYKQIFKVLICKKCKTDNDFFLQTFG